MSWNWQTTEFLLKGVYLGLLVTIAWLLPAPDELALISAFMIAGLLVFLGVAAYRKIQEGYRIRNNWFGFLIFLVLENPGLVYAGLLVGLSIGVGWTFKWWRPAHTEKEFHAAIEVLIEKQKLHRTELDELRGEAGGAKKEGLDKLVKRQEKLHTDINTIPLGDQTRARYPQFKELQKEALDQAQKAIAKIQEREWTEATASMDATRASLESMQEAIPQEAIWPVLGGVLLGLVFSGLRNVTQPLYRFGLSLAMAAILVGGTVAASILQPQLTVFNEAHFKMVGLLLLIGLPGFYLLTFASLVEESEIEIGAMCAALGIGLWAFMSGLNAAVSGTVVVILPLAIFFFYTTRIMPWLRVFKHALRGMSYRHMGQTKLALISLGRALQLAPDNELARQQLWDIHRDLNFAELKNEPDILPHLNFNFCLGRIAQVLQTKPGDADLAEVRKMLDLIAHEQAAYAPICSYWRCVAALHERNIDEAAAQLRSILQLPQDYTPHRQAIQYQAWVLALIGHPEMNKRVGSVLMRQIGHRMDAIHAVENQLSVTPQDPTALEFKSQFYSEITEREYFSINQPGQPPATRFDHVYAEQLGASVLDDPQLWQRGCEYLRIAAHGLPTKACAYYIRIAQAHEKHGDLAGVWANYLKAMQIGRAIGIENFEPADKEALFAAVKSVGELALKHEQTDVALEAFKFYSLNENAGIETYRILADLFEKKKEVWLALHCTEHALKYNAEDKDLLARKDRYYYSIAPDDLKRRWESVQSWFDPQYCKDKARFVIDRFNGDFDTLDWALHLAELAIAAQPEASTPASSRPAACGSRARSARRLPSSSWSARTAPKKSPAATRNRPGTTCTACSATSISKATPPRRSSATSNSAKAKTPAPTRRTN